jgi:ankyrin repeat protein
LTANRLAEPIRDVSRYHIRLEAAHTILAQACLGVLLLLDDRVDRDKIENFPLARYAAQYWATHARFENALSRIKDGIERLFDADKPPFATWLWIYNKDRNGKSMRTMFPEEPDAVPLYYAASFGFCDLAEHLIAEHPEHVNARGGNEITPMHAAARAGHADILLLLLVHGADLGGQGIAGQSPLHLTSFEGKLKAGKCLLDRGADINALDMDDWTPLYSAAFKGQVECARMLLERGATIDARAKDGTTPLHRAVELGYLQVVRLLLEHGADVNTRNEDGETPFQLGSNRGLHEIVELLSKYGAESV